MPGVPTPSITVTDTNSAWQTINIFEVGVGAPNNTLIISNGAQVVNVGTFTELGGVVASTNDNVFVDGPGSVLVGWRTRRGRVT